MEKRKIKKNSILLLKICSILIISFIYFFRISDSYNYDSDFGRDLSDILQICRGNLTLIGPKLSFGGLHIAPYYYYLFAPALLISNFNPSAMLYFNAFIFILISSFILLNSEWCCNDKIKSRFHLSSLKLLIKQVLRRFNGSKKNIKRALLNFNELYEKGSFTFGILWILTTPFFIYSARQAGNAFSYIAMLLLWILLFPKISPSKKSWLWILYGFFIGVIINFHFIVSIILLSFGVVAILSMIKHREWIRFRYYCSLLTGIIFAFVPLVLFEIKNNFVMLRNTFVHKSYLAFTENQNLPNPLTTSTSSFKNFFLLGKHAGQWINFPLVLLVFTVFILFIINRKKMSNQLKIITLSSVLSYILLIIIAKTQLAFHYFFPFILLLQTTLVLLLKKYKKAVLLFTVLVFFNLIKFPTHYYLPASRPIANFLDFIDDFKKSDTALLIEGNSYNIFVIRETPLAVLGREYRYLLELNGYSPKSIFTYNESDYLLVIKEQEFHNINVDSLSSWELDQFGNKVLAHDEIIQNRVVELYLKQ